MSLKKTAIEFPLDVLDKELIIRGSRFPESKRLDFKDPDPFLLRDEVMSETSTLYRNFESAIPNPDLAHLDINELARAVMEKTLDRSKERALFDKDDRTDFYEIPEGPAQKNAESIVAITTAKGLVQNKKDLYELKTRNFGEAFSLCDREPFFHQPIAAGGFCTGFLVDEDIIATAGHAVNPGNLDELQFIFDFRVDHPRCSAKKRFPGEKVYKGVEIIGRKLERIGNLDDWTLVRLDRKVRDRQIVYLSQRHVIPKQEVYVIGHPLGLPLKYAPGAQVCDTVKEAFFKADLDIYSGNSGSPVFDSSSHEVVGMVVRGAGNDFRWTGSCWISAIFQKGREYGIGAHCTRVSQFIQKINRY